MRPHSYYSSSTSDYDTLLRNAIEYWAQYAEKRYPMITFNTRYVDWHCVKCRSEIKVHFMTTDVKRMYCENCRPKVLRARPQYLVRYMNSFKAHVRYLIAEHSGFGEILEDANCTIETNRNL